MKRLFTLLVSIILLFNAKILAQEVVEIQGRIVDEKSSQPVAFANVSVFKQKDSTVAGGTVTNENGEFTIKGIPKDIYYIQVSNMGYQNKRVDNIEFSGKSKVDIGNVGISSAEIALSEVNVIGDKLKGQEKVDRTVYAVPSNIKSVSNSGLDVLKHIPAVNVDLQENVTLEGRSDIVFYVDGVQRDKDFVSQINPASIDRVEVVTNPSARYGGDVSGVIEIFLIKEKAYGISGRLSADIPSPPSIIMNPSGNLDYGFANVRLYVSDRLHLERFNGFQETNTLRYINDQEYKQSNYGEGKMGWKYNNFSYGMDWFINDNNTLNFYGNLTYYESMFKDFKFDSKQFINEDLVSKELINQDDKNSGNSKYYSLFYKRKFENQDHQLTMQTSFYDYTGFSNQNFTYHQLDINNDEEISQYSRIEKIDNSRKSVDFVTDYSLSRKKSSLEAGVKSYYQWFDNVYASASDANNNFVYNELRMAAYSNFTYKFQKLTIQAGLRAEMSQTEIANSAKNDYLSLLPQFSMIRQFEKSQNLKLNVRRRIFRPGIDELNPFLVWTDSLHAQRGNPDLEPAYSNDLELVYSKNFNSSMISPKLYAKYLTGNFQDVSAINSNGVIESITQNIGKSWEYGISVNYALKLAKWWMINGYAKVCDNIIYNIDTESNDIAEKVNFQMDLTSVMTFFKTWNFMIISNYRSPYISYQQTNYRDFLLLLGLEKELFKNAKLQVIYLPPYTNKFTFQKYITKTRDLENYWKGGIKADYLFAFQFSYSFRTGKKVKELQRSTDFDSDTNKSLF